MTAHPHLPGQLTDRVAAGPAGWRQVSSEIGFASDYLTLTVDTIAGPDGEQHARVVVRPRGAVAVAAVDDDGRILLVEQYRHPMGRRMLEIPAGLLDVPGESAEQAAARELAEEADLVAAHWRPLLSLAPTVGYSTEQIDLFVATGLRPVPEPDRIVREAEEADLRLWWVDLDDAADAVFDGRIIDAKTIAAVLALGRSRTPLP